MPRKAQFPPRVTRHQTGQARVYWRGQTFYLGLYGSPAAERAYAELLTRLTEGEGSAQNAQPAPPAPASSHTTVADVAAAFLADAQHVCRTEQVKLFAAALAPLVRLLGFLPAADLDDSRLEEVRREMVSGAWMNEEERERRRQHRQPVGWCRTTANRHVKRIVTIWRWAERRKLVPPGSRANLQTLPPLPRHSPGVREAPRRRATSRDELDRVLPFVQEGRAHRPVATMLELQYLLGCRSTEVCIMRPCDIDRTGGPCVDGVQVWLYRPEFYKTQHVTDVPRVVAIGPAAQRLLAPWLLACPGPDAYLFRPKHAAKRPRYHVGVYDCIVWRACKKAGVKVIPYGGRRAAADRAKKDYGMEGARAVLGHATIGQTADYIEMLDIETAARAAANLG